MYSQQRSHSRLSNPMQDSNVHQYPPLNYTTYANQGSSPIDTSQVSRNQQYYQQTQDAVALNLVNSGKTMTFADDSQKFNKRPALHLDSQELQTHLNDVRSPANELQPVRDTSSQRRKKGSKLRKRIPKSKSSQNRNSPTK